MAIAKRLNTAKGLTLPAPMARFLARHDDIALKRQASLSTLLIIVDATLAVVLAYAINVQHWHLNLPDGAVVALVSIGALSLLFLLLASDFPLILRDMVTAIAVGPTHPSDARLVRYRPLAFYPGVYLTLALLVALTAFTGGLLKSPFTSVIYALVLAAQQLSRYRRQAGYYVLAGAVATVALLVIDASFTFDPVPAPPGGLSFTVLVFAFGSAALFSQLYKPPNPRTLAQSAIPTSVVLYTDALGTWHYSLYHKWLKLDVPIVGVDDIKDARRHVERMLRRIISEDAPSAKAVIRWQPSLDNTDCVCSVTIERHELA